MRRKLRWLEQSYEDIPNHKFPFLRHLVAVNQILFPEVFQKENVKIICNTNNCNG